jgi:hypothetical protein
MSKAFLLATVFSALLLSSLAAGQESCAWFSILAADTINAEPGTSIDIDLAIRNTGTCAGDTMVIAVVPKDTDWSATQFLTKELAPGETQMTEANPIKISIPADAQTSKITLLADSAEPLNIDVIIGDIPVQNAIEQTPSEPPVNVTPTIPVINVTNIIPLPVEETPNESEPQEIEKQSADQEPAAIQTSPTTGLLTANPAVYGAILVVFLFGAVYLYESRKIHGYRYRN